MNFQDEFKNLGAKPIITPPPQGASTSAPKQPSSNPQTNGNAGAVPPIQTQVPPQHQARPVTPPPAQQAAQQPAQSAPPQPSNPASPNQATSQPKPENLPVKPAPVQQNFAGDNIKTENVVQATQTSSGPKKSSAYIGEIMVEKGIISKDQLEIALKVQRENKDKRIMLGSILIDLGFITESALGEILAESTGIEKFDPRTTVLDPNLIKQIPKNIAQRHKLIPISLVGESVHIAMSDVYNVLAIDQVQRYFPKNFKIVPVYAAETDILELIDHYYEYEMSVDGILKEIETGIAEKKEIAGGGEKEGYINPTVRLVDAILIDAIKRGSSDIHFEPEGSFLRLRYRIDGQMMQIRSFHSDYWPAIAVRIKIMSGMNIAETRSPQDGRISYNVLGREIDFRVATQPTVYGENIVMRILDKKKSLVPLDQLGFSPNAEKLLKKLLKRPEGIVIVTGPTGSGKTTTLYSVLSFINSVDVNIMTLEDPVEYQLPMIRQSNVREGSMGFSTGIKSLMRQDPDIIFVGEVRDEDTANMALRAAMTGHQVFTTLHTNDALGAIPRLVDIGIKPTLLAGSLICCMAQRLARKLCDYCKKEKVATLDECRILGVDPTKAPRIFERVGCEKCGGKGYKGRVAIAEILPIDRDMDELIAQNATRRVMLEHAMKQGFIPMMQDGINKVLSGAIDLEELIGTIDMTGRL